MSNGEFCCAIGVCCPPASTARRMALVNELVHGTGCEAAEMQKVADWLIDNVDMMPVGTLQPLVAAIQDFHRPPKG